MFFVIFANVAFAVAQSTQTHVDVILNLHQQQQQQRGKQNLITAKRHLFHQFLDIPGGPVACNLSSNRI